MGFDNGTLFFCKEDSDGDWKPLCKVDDVSTVLPVEDLNDCKFELCKPESLELTIEMGPALSKVWKKLCRFVRISRKQRTDIQRRASAVRRRKRRAEKRRLMLEVK